MHNDYSLAPEKVKITHNMLSKYCSDIATKNDLKIGNVRKLVLSLGNKTRYVFHYRNL